MKGISLGAALSLLLVLTPSISFSADFATGEKCYKAKDYACALKEWQFLADQGDAQAQTRLGRLYHWGEGVEKNYEEALKWYRKAANQGHAAAQHFVGVMYYFSRGVTRDYVNAANWYRKAADQGHAGAQYSLGSMYAAGRGVASDKAEAVKWYIKAADQDSKGAPIALGDIYAFSHNGMQDYTEAAKWYIKAFDQGHKDAANRLGEMYSGSVVTKDHVKAVKWYLKAADQGSKAALFRLGAMYQKSGITQDYDKALKLYRKTAEEGSTEAEFRLGTMHEKGEGVKQDYAKAIKRYLKAADQGNQSALFRLGTMHEKGEGVKQDYEKALDFYKRSENDYKSKHAYRTLKRRMPYLMPSIICKKNSTTKLFNVLVKCANRGDLRTAVKNGGAAVKSEDIQKWGDNYDSSNVLKGTSELRISYTVDNLFAKALYSFPSRMDAQQIAQVRDFVANKYGQPDSSSGQVSLGNVRFDWVLQDGIKLSVSRGWPDTTTYMSYIYPEHYKAMTDEQERQRKAREAKQYQNQSNAF